VSLRLQPAFLPACSSTQQRFLVLARQLVQHWRRHCGIANKREAGCRGGFRVSPNRRLGFETLSPEPYTAAGLGFRETLNPLPKFRGRSGVAEMFLSFCLSAISRRFAGFRACGRRQKGSGRKAVKSSVRRLIREGGLRFATCYIICAMRFGPLNQMRFSQKYVRYAPLVQLRLLAVMLFCCCHLNE
jgi:hypothetical protein